MVVCVCGYGREDCWIKKMKWGKCYDERENRERLEVEKTERRLTHEMHIHTHTHTHTCTRIRMGCAYIYIYDFSHLFPPLSSDMHKRLSFAHTHACTHTHILTN